jgi:hypothetical protein
MLLAAPGFAQTSAESFAPRREASAPTYLNAEIVRISPVAGTVTIRSESGDSVLTVDRDTVPGTAALRVGDKVLVAYQTLFDEDGPARRIVTYLRPASPTSGEPEPSLAVASAGTSGSTDRTTRARVRAVGGTATTTVVPANLAASSPRGASSTASVSTPGPTAVSGGTAATGGGTFSPMGASSGVPVVGIALPSVGPTSPYASTVPSIPAPTPVLNAVLPPAIAKAPQADEEVGAIRAQGERDFDGAAMVLAMIANEIDGAWVRYKTACLAGVAPESTPGREWFLLLDGRVRTPDDDQCRMMYTRLQGMAAGFDQQLAIALDAARRTDVLPGRVREILERHRIDR